VTCIQSDERSHFDPEYGGGPVEFPSQTTDGPWTMSLGNSGIDKLSYPHNPHPAWRARAPVCLAGKGDPISSDATADITSENFRAHEPYHHDEMGVPPGGHIRANTVFL
jgi:hypothetical protein